MAFLEYNQNLKLYNLNINLTILCHITAGNTLISRLTDVRPLHTLHYDNEGIKIQASGMKLCQPLKVFTLNITC